jgi:hypothetical protein
MAMPVMTMSFAASDFIRKMNMRSSDKDAPNGHSPAQERRHRPVMEPPRGCRFLKARGTCDRGQHRQRSLKFE